MKGGAAVAGLCLILPLASCDRETEGRLSFDLVSTCLVFDRPTERVFRSDAEWSAVHHENSDNAAPAIDFSRSMVAGRFDGYGYPNTTFSVQDVGERDGSIVVRATRHERTGPTLTVVRYPQVLVLLPHRDVPVRFEIHHVVGESQGPARACETRQIRR